MGHSSPSEAIGRAGARAAAALLAALTALYEWARDDDLALGDAIDLALRTLEGDDDPRTARAPSSS